MTGDWIRLEGRQSEIILEVPDDGFPVWHHWGNRIDGETEFVPWLKTRPVPTFSLDQNQPFRTFPVFGRGWFGPSALSAHRNGLDWAPETAPCKIQSEPGRLTLTLDNKAAGMRIVQTLSMDAETDVLTLSAELTNTGRSALNVAWLTCGSLPVPANARSVESFSGRHNNEFQPVSSPLSRAGWRRENRQGLTSHNCPPLATVLGDGAGQHAGPVWSAQLAWSGNHQQSLDSLEDGKWVWMAGAWLAPGEISLNPGERFASPDWLATYSPAGRNGTAQNFHAHLRKRSPLRREGGMSPRPVHINTWEGFYFDHDETDLKSLADMAAALGVERFVLDDGWFKGRSDDTAALGDWTPDPLKYPAGLAPLAKHVCDLGMTFGLWVEPEMVNPNSDLFRAHPDWVLRLGEDLPLTARNQLVLDLTQDAVQDHLFDALDTLLGTLPISYLKWDHNRALTEAGSTGRAAYYRQTQALYMLIERLLETYPDVEIESCAAGGGRIDAGILSRMHRVWTSDCLDAVSRERIQKGFLQYFPPEIMGAHIGVGRAHTTGRTQSLSFRAGIALMGHLGLELDARTLSAGDQAKLRSWIALYKQIRETSHAGQVWTGDAGDGVTWTAMGSPNDFVLFLVRTDPTSMKFPPQVMLPFATRGAVYSLVRIDPGARFRGNAENVPFADPSADPFRISGGWLAEIGLPLPHMNAETCLILRGVTE